MARARNIKPGFFRNADLAELPYECRLLFAGLWILADREGRLEDRPKQIKMEIFPADNLDVDALLDQLAGCNLIVRYTAFSKRYVWVRNFLKHQNPHVKEAASTIPAYDEHSASPVQAPDTPSAGRCDSCSEPVQARLIPDSGFLIPDSLQTGGCKAEPVLDHGMLNNGGEEESGREENKAPPSRSARDGDFQMDLDWKPSQHFPTLARQAGIPEDQITAESLAEFRSYWIGQGKVMTQHQWDHKLLTSLKAQHLRGWQAPPSRAPPGRRQPQNLSEGRTAAAKAIFNPGPIGADDGHERRTIDVTPAPADGVGAKALR